MHGYSFTLTQEHILIRTYVCAVNCARSFHYGSISRLCLTTVNVCCYEMTYLIRLQKHLYGCLYAILLKKVTAITSVYILLRLSQCLC